MTASTKSGKYRLGMLLVLVGLALWLALPNLPAGRASASGRAGKSRAQKQAASGLSAERQAALEKLYAQFKAGAPFSEEESNLLRKFGAGSTLTDLEADVVISRALYDYYIAATDLTKEQQELLDQYTLSVARRATDVADLKTQLLNKRKAAAAAAPPHVPQVAPPNDLCAGAEVIPAAGPFPYLTAITADITDATTTGDPPLPSCQTNLSRSIWYRLTPTTSGIYTISTCVFDGTATTVEDTVMAIYTSSGVCAGPFTEIPTSGASDGCDDDSCVDLALQAVITTQLNAGTQYYIVVWLFDAPPPTSGSTAVQLRVSQVAAPVNDTCAGAVALSLDKPVNGTTAAAVDDYQLSGAACFTGVGQAASTATGNDVVYSFTAPVAGNYSFKVTNFEVFSRLVLYVASSCPAATPGTPVTVGTCLGAANRASASSAEEVMCLSLTLGQQVFIFVDQSAVTSGSAFTIEVNICTRETEANDTPATANTLACGVEGTMSSGTDADFYSLGTPAIGSRVFAIVDGVAGNSTDFDMRVTTTTDTLEHDDADNDPPFGSVAPNVAGTPTTGVATFLRVNHRLGTIAEPYRLYAVVQPPMASATSEAEPNNTPATANSAANNYFTGSLAGPAPSTDVDVFSFTANAGDMIFMSLDCDPTRNNTPVNGALALLNTNGATLVSVNSSGSTSSTTSGAGSLTAITPFSPGEALVYRATTTGTYYARVFIGTTSPMPSGAGDYLLSISRNCFAGTPPTVSISGTVSYCVTPASKVPNVTFTMSPPAQTGISDGSGNYSLSGLTQNGNFTVTPSKTGAINSISTTDATRILQQLAGTVTLTPCQQLAGDTSQNGSLSTTDASQILNFLAGNPPAANNHVGEWRFSPASLNYTNLSANQSNQNYDALLLGDVTGNWVPAGPQPAKANAPLAVTVTLPTASPSTSVTNFTLPITISDTTGQQITGYRMRIVYDQTVVSITGADNSGTLSSNFTIIPNTSTPGVIIIAAGGASPLAGAGTLLKLNFTRIGGANTSTSLQFQTQGAFPGLQVDDANENIVPSTGVNGMISIVMPSAVKLNSLTATGYEKGVFLQWQTGYEANNLGFNIYRQQGRDLALVTPDIVAGSALVTGTAALTAGRSYGWWDPLAQDKQDTLYYIEDVDLNGARTLHGPVAPVRLSGRPPEHTQAALLSEVGKGSSTIGPPPLVLQPAKANFAAGAQNDFPLASGPAVKIAVREEGWYRITQPELLAAGLAANTDPRFLQLYVDGQELPIVVTGEADGKLDAADTVEFFGRGVDTAATDTRVYWLVAGSQSGARLQVAPPQKGLPSPRSFPYPVQRKDRTVYFSGLRNGDRENFFGAVIAGNSVDQAITVQNLDQASREQALLEVALQGVTLTGHQVRVLLNGIDVGLVIFNGQAQGVVSLSVSSALLKEGANQVTLAAMAGQSDVSLVDYIRLTYQHTYTADNNALRLTASSNQTLTLDGFTSGKIQVVDVTNGSATQELKGAIQQTKSGYSVTFTSPGSDQRMLFAFAGEQAKHPAAVWANRPSKLKQPGLGADLLILTRPDFFDSLAPLKAFRQRQGLAVTMIDVEDLYDEFSYGQKSPQAVKDFLTFAKLSWKKAPRFVLFAGDASYDPKNYLGRGDFDFVPTKLIDTQYMEAASDDWLADINGDSVADMAVGRLPVRTAQEAFQVVTKIIDYEQSGRPEGVLLVADSNDGYDFEGMNAQLKALIPPDIKVTEIDRGRVGTTAAKSQLLMAINEGKKIVNYAGHGSVDLWRANLLTSSDVSSMHNGANTTLFVMMTCLNGYFTDPQLDSLAEALLKWSNGGAVAVWASTGMTVPSDQAVINSEAYRWLFNGGDGLTLGEVTLKAKALVGDQDVRQTWVLFGDPTMRLKR